MCSWLLLLLLLLASGCADRALRCGKCGHRVASVDDLIHDPDFLHSDHGTSKHAQLIEAVSAPAWRLANPQGQQFEVVAVQVSSASGLSVAPEGSAEHSFAPGHAWHFAVCGRCNHFLGWGFSQGGTVQAAGLICDKLDKHVNVSKWKHKPRLFMDS